MAAHTKEEEDEESAFAEDEADEEAVHHFITKWNLQTESQNLLLGLDSTAQIKVINEFAPRDTSRDVNAIFMKFASGVANGTPQQHQQGADLGSEELRAFIEQWSLGAEAQQILVGLTPQGRARVIKEFSPRDTSRDVNAIFIKFAQGIALGAPRTSKGVGKGIPAPVHVQAYPPQRGFAAAHPPPVARPHLPAYHSPYTPAPAPQPQAASVDGPSLQAFIAKWQLHPEAQSVLLGLDPAAQRKVMVEFAPRDTSRDVNAIFCKFAQGVGQKDRGSSAYKSFVAQWRLGQEAQALFYSLRPEVQQKVMLEFRPRDTSSDVNNIFMKFAQGVAQGTPRVSGGQGRAAGGAAFVGGAAFAGGSRFSPY